MKALIKTMIDVKNRKEAETIRAALKDPAVRAFALIMGTLNELPTDRARKRVLDFVIDKLDEEQSE